MAIKKRTTRRKPGTKKMNPVVIGAGVLAAGYLGYTFLYKPWKEKKDLESAAQDAAAAAAQAATAAAAAGSSAGQLPAGPSTSGGITGLVGNTSSMISNLVQAANQAPANATGSGSLNTTKVILPGDPASPELKTCKTIFNDIIRLAKGYRNRSDLSVSQARLVAISNIPVLDTTTKYGDATKTAAKIILGKTQFTVQECRTKRKNFYLALGLPNPY